ncbi:hypothetical protein CFP71_19120 [Amycolatopsis thailandensis]|uniref:Uncharacterized protein n=1 Tax=Amycolatopsis thailandensis TaxID=589330 RepID=A0A229S8A7_9PSEU|nr:hypothetical protein [Amycolatopsis thailandensis]OXM54824.1 hypothetical protein CFP71_19120 [Amycolatopsis thailandensis]
MPSGVQRSACQGTPVPLIPVAEPEPAPAGRGNVVIRGDLYLVGRANPAGTASRVAAPSELQRTGIEDSTVVL